MLVDIASGLWIYALASIYFGKVFHVTTLALALFFAFLPDLDIPIYLVWRKKMGWISHHLIHFPLIFIPIGITIFWFSEYISTLFFLGVTAHFIHDMATTPQGIQWIWPFSPTGWTLCYGKLRAISPKERNQIFENVRQLIRQRHGNRGRSLIEEITCRLEKPTPGKLIYISFSLLIFLLFLVHNAS